MALDRTVISFFIIFMTVYFLESIGGFYMTTAIVSIEKQFQIPSKTSGMMISAGDFGYIPSVIFVAYLGGKGNRARWIGMGCILIALANVLVSSSNFLFSDNVVNTTSIGKSILKSGNDFDCFGFLGNKTVAENNSTWCENTYSKLRPSLLTSSFAFCNKGLNEEKRMYSQETCKNEQMNYVGPTALIFGGLFILGIGRTMPFSLGLPLVDDNVKKANLPVYFAGMFVVRLLGPVIGFGMGTLFNTQYYKFTTPAGLTHVDPDWIGRWWAGFLIIGVALFLPSLLLFFFPTPKPNADGTPSSLALVDRHIKRNSDGEAIIPKTIDSKVKGVMKQPIYVWAMIGRIMDVFIFKGFFVFLPKYVEVQFGLPQYKIHMYMGIIGVFGFAIGVLSGTVIMKKFKLEGRRAASWVAMCSAAAAILSFANITVGCDSTLTALGQNLTAKMDLNIPCMSNCHCDKMPMFPVCDKENNVFYSPCHAGCPFGLNEIQLFNTSHDRKEKVIFSNCKCVPNGEVSRQFCATEECEFAALKYFFIIALGGVIGGMGVTTGVLIILRSVPPIHRSISLGFQGFLVSLLATLPSPVFWGFIIDKLCIKWDQRCEGSNGSCALYDAPNLRIWLHLLNGGLRLFSLFADVMVIYHAKDLKLVEEVEEKKTEEVKLESVNKEVNSLLNEDKDKKQHRRTPSGGVASKIAFHNEENKSRKGSIASEILFTEMSQPGVP
ncbi:hypothetical protein FO519_003664 [Halicephalobus sp. NKZ332]|nr:hypothetical protein FO519_003664 [Halicephalobus sp. NKZ332]